MNAMNPQDIRFSAQYGVDIIGLAGPRGVGKTTYARAMVEASTKPAVAVSFADAVRRHVNDELRMSGVADDDLDAIIASKNDIVFDWQKKSYRQMLHDHASADPVGNALLVLEYALYAIRHNVSLGMKLIVFDDVRTVQEVDMIHMLEGRVVELYREGVTYSMTEWDRPLGNLDYLLHADDDYLIHANGQRTT